MDKLKESKEAKHKTDKLIKKEMELINNEMSKIREEAVRIEKGIESHIDGKRTFRKIYTALFLIGFAVSITSLLNADWMVFSCSMILELLSLLLYHKSKKMDVKRKFNVYLIIWIFWFLVAVFSIWRSKNILSIISFAILFVLSLFASISGRKLKEEMIGEEIKRMQTKLKRYETNFDRLIIILNRYKSVKISVFAKAFNISRQQIEEWAEILENHNLLEVHYPFLGEPELRLIQKNKKEAEK